MQRISTMKHNSLADSTREGVEIKKSSGIYRINLGNGWFYIGSAKNLVKRKNEHFAEVKVNGHCNKIVQNCWNKYQVFGFTILEECAKTDLIVREQIYLDQHFDDPKNANIGRVARSPMAGRTHSVSSLAKMVASHQNRSAETKAKMSLAHKGKSCSPETRKKIGVSHKGKTCSAEARANMSVSAKLRSPDSDETRAKKSAAKQNMSDETRSKMSASAKLGWVKRKNMCAVVQGLFIAITLLFAALLPVSPVQAHGRKYKCEQWAEKFAEYGLPIEVFGAIANRESRCNPNAINAIWDKQGKMVWSLNKNGSWDSGLLQINSIHKERVRKVCGRKALENNLAGLRDIDCNLAVAAEIYAGGKGLSHWYFSAPTTHSTTEKD